jgi:asparagine synthase (glutamine-hydrolysing)
VLENIGRDAEAAYYVDLCFSKPWHTATLLGRSPRDFRNSASYEQIVAPYRRCSSESAVARAQYADLLGYLPNDVLTKVDRMTMAHGLEVRNPLLDHRIVEFAFRVPTPALLRCGHPKHLLRSLGARWLPPAVVRGTKHGFTAPVATWFRDAMGQRLEAEALAPDSELRGLIDVPVLTRTLREHQSGRANHSHTLWASWVLQRWLREQRKHTADVGT